jgi:hypothetical protein
MGIGSKIKDRWRKIMPNEVSELMGKAAPIVSMMGPMGAILGAGMAWNSEFDRTGRMGSSLKKAGKTFVTGKVGQAVGGQFGGAENVGIKSLMPGSGYWTDVGFNVTGGEYVPYSLSDAAASQAKNITTASGGSVPVKTIDARNPIMDPRADASGSIKGYRAARYRPQVVYTPEGVPLDVGGYGNIKGGEFTVTDTTTDPSKMYIDKSGRIIPGDRTFTGDAPIRGDSFSGSKYNLFDPDGTINPERQKALLGVESSLRTEDPKFTERLGEAWTEFKEAEGFDKMKVALDFMMDPANQLVVQALGGTLAAVAQYLENKALEDDKINLEKGDLAYKPEYRNIEDINPTVQLSKNGGIIGLANGGEPTMEMDYRGGGFIPVGAQERADDVPARLSKNEFVMTADAVRAAGGGSVDVGAQRMYNLMNRLEAVA